MYILHRSVNGGGGYLTVSCNKIVTGVERGNMKRKKIVPLGNVGDPGDNNAQKHFGPEKPERMHC